MLGELTSLWVCQSRINQALMRGGRRADGETLEAGEEPGRGGQGIVGGGVRNRGEGWEDRGWGRDGERGTLQPGPVLCYRWALL